MRVTKYSHACLRIEREGAIVVIDPGTLSEPESVDGVDAILITHEHFDHLDVQKLVDAVAKRPAITVYTHPDVVPKLGEFGGAVTQVVPGDDFTAAGFRVRTYGGLHAMIHPDLPRVANVGFFVEGEGGAGGVYHPGDSLHVPGQPVETLLVPAQASWLKTCEAIDFVRAVNPQRTFPIHDGQLNERGLHSINSWLGEQAGSRYRWLAPGETA